MAEKDWLAGLDNSQHVKETCVNVEAKKKIQNVRLDTASVGGTEQEQGEPGCEWSPRLSAAYCSGDRAPVSVGNERARRRWTAGVISAA